MGKSLKKGRPSEEPALHHDAPVAGDGQKPEPPKTDVPKITVKLAACGLLLENELKRQKAAGLVERYGQLRLEGVLLQPNKMHVMPKSKIVEKAILDGWIVDMGVCP